MIDELIHKNPKNILVRAFIESNIIKFDPITFFI